MPYEVFKRTRITVQEPTVSLVPDGRIAFNAAAARLLREARVEAVLLLWDNVRKKLALKAAAKGEKNTYAVSIVRNSYSGSLRAKSFLDYIGWRALQRISLPATWNKSQKMMEVSLAPANIQRTRKAMAKGKSNSVS